MLTGLWSLIVPDSMSLFCEDVFGFLALAAGASGDLPVNFKARLTMSADVEETGHNLSLEIDSKLGTLILQLVE